jgi:hypothetical protein
VNVPFKGKLQDGHSRKVIFGPGGMFSAQNDWGYFACSRNSF